MKCSLLALSLGDKTKARLRQDNQCERERRRERRRTIFRETTGSARNAHVVEGLCFLSPSLALHNFLCCLCVYRSFVFPVLFRGSAAKTKGLMLAPEGPRFFFFFESNLPNIAWRFRQRCECPGIFLTFLCPWISSFSQPIVRRDVFPSGLPLVIMIL